MKEFKNKNKQTKLLTINFQIKITKQTHLGINNKKKQQYIIILV